ncbi:MAG: hypothetical protein ACN4E2_03860 [Nitrospinota bacterium]
MRVSTVLTRKSSFADTLSEYQKGTIPEIEFNRFRVGLGIYPQRQESFYMVRTKIVAGVVDSEKLRHVAHLADRFADKIVHFTSRQNIQFHFVKLDNVVTLLDRLNSSGITTMGACGNTLRNVNVCDHSEAVAPLAVELSRHLMELDLAFELPRKLKITLSDEVGGCATTLTSDIAIVRSEQSSMDGDWLFDLLVGGGQGAMPKLASKLHSGLHAKDLYRAIVAVLEVFAKEGHGVSRNRSRIKFLVDRIGIERFRTLYEEEYIKVALEYPFEIDPVLASPARAGLTLLIRSLNADYTVKQLLTIATILDMPEVNNNARISKKGSLLLFGVPDSKIESLVKIVSDSSMNLEKLDDAPSITVCNGSSTCPKALLNTKDLGETVESQFKDIFRSNNHLSIAVSGCPNSCANCYTANIGLIAGAKNINGESIAMYQLYLGGSELAGKLALRTKVKIPTDQVIDIIRLIGSLFLKHRINNEHFRELLDRVEVDYFAKAANDLIQSKSLKLV